MHWSYVFLALRHQYGSAKNVKIHQLMVWIHKFVLFKLAHLLLKEIIQYVLSWLVH